MMITEKSMKKDKKKSFPNRVFGSDVRKGTVTLPQMNHDLYIVMIREMEDRVFGSDERKGTVNLPQLKSEISRVIKNGIKKMKNG